MADSRDWLDQTKSLMEKRLGRPPTEDDIIAHYTHHGEDARIWIRHNFDGMPKEEIEYNEADMGEALERSALRRRMEEVEALLRGRR